MRASPVDLIGGFYADDSLPWSCQDTVNWLPVMAEVGGTRTPSKLATPPGLKPYQNIGTGPIRGMHDLEGGRFVVSGRYLLRIDTNGVGVPVGIIPGVGRVSMTHNQFKTGYQLLVENGQGGGGYVYDSNTKAFGRITDEGYPGSISSDYLDSYLLGVEPQGRYWFHSNLADATDYNTLDRYESEASPDKIVGLAVSQLEVVVFNQRTIEFFYNSGGATGTFQNRRQSITRGCASRHTIAKLDNTLFWLGDDGIVYRLEGYSARPISTGPMHRAFAGKNWSEAFAQVWEDRGFKVYYLTFPDGMTFGYDVVSGLWTRRQSFGLNRWRLSHIVKWGDKWYGGDFQDGRMWELDWGYLLEGDQPLIGERVTPVLADDQSDLVIPSAELIFDTGQGPETVPAAFPNQPPPPSITGSPPQGQIGVAYSYQFTVDGTFPPLTVSDEGGSLPMGLSITNSGLLSGTPLESFSGSIHLRVNDARGMWSVGSFELTILGLQHWNAADKASSVVLSDDDRVAEVVIPTFLGGFGGVRGVQSRNAGRYYVEFEWTRYTSGFVGYVGLITGVGDLSADPQTQSDLTVGCRQTNQFNIGGTNTATAPPTAAGVRVGIAVDLGSRRAWIAVDGVWKLGSSPDNTPGGLLGAAVPAGAMFPVFYSADNSGGLSHQMRLIVEGAQQMYRPSGFLSWGGI